MIFLVKFSHFVRMGVDREAPEPRRFTITWTLEHLNSALFTCEHSSALAFIDGSPYIQMEHRAIIAEKARICTAISLIASDCGKLNSLFLLISFIPSALFPFCFIVSPSFVIIFIKLISNFSFRLPFYWSPFRFFFGLPFASLSASPSVSLLSFPPQPLSSASLLNFPPRSPHTSSQ